MLKSHHRNIYHKTHSTRITQRSRQPLASRRVLQPHRSMSYQAIPIKFTPGQLHHTLQPLSDDYTPIFTTASTETNPEVTAHTKFDNVTATHYYDPNYDPSMFHLTLQTFCIRFSAKNAGAFLQQANKQQFISELQCKHIIPDTSSFIVSPTSSTIVSNLPKKQGDPTCRRILINSIYFPSALSSEPFTITNDTISPSQQLNESTQMYSSQKLLQDLPQSMRTLITELHGTIEPQTIIFPYEYFTYDDVLTALIPPTVTIPTSFTSTGHIVHFNLRHEQLPFQYIIGRCAVDKLNGIRTAINKVGSINNVYRNFQAELLYGDNNFVTTLKQHGFSFCFDFSQVYWNSRLATEHNRIAQFVHKSWSKTYPTIASTTLTSQQQDVHVIDLFGGIGPFAVPLAKQSGQGKLFSQQKTQFYADTNRIGCRIWCNDINPRSSLYAWKNIHLNRLVPKSKPQSSLSSSSLSSGEHDSPECRKLISKLHSLRQKLTQANISPEHQAEVHAKISDLQAQVDALKQGQMHEEHINDNAQSDQPQQQQQQRKKHPLVSSVQTPLVQVYNNCARELMRAVACTQMKQIISGKYDQVHDKAAVHLPYFQHTIMNLPASAVEFLDMYVGLYTNTSLAYPFQWLSPSETSNATAQPQSPQIHFLSTNQTSSNITTTPQPDNTAIASPSNAAADDDLNMLPCALDEQYANLIENTPFNNPNHHWLTLQQMYRTMISKKAPVAQSSISVPSPQTIISQLRLDTNPFIVHCYCFVQDEFHPKSEAFNLVEHFLGFQLPHTGVLTRQQIDPSYVVPGIECQYENQRPIIASITRQESGSSASSSTPSSLFKTLSPSQLYDIDSIPDSIPSTTPLPTASRTTASSIVPPPTTSQQQHHSPYTNPAFPPSLTSPDIASNSLTTFLQAQNSSFFSHGSQISPSNTTTDASTVSTPHVTVPRDILSQHEQLLRMEYNMLTLGYHLHNVRDVAPGKNMFCVSFVVPDYVLFYSPEYHAELTKRQQNSHEQPLDEYEQYLLQNQNQYRGKVTATPFLYNLWQKNGRDRSEQRLAQDDLDDDDGEDKSLCKRLRTV